MKFDQENTNREGTTQKRKCVEQIQGKMGKRNLGKRFLVWRFLVLGRVAHDT